MSFAKSMGTHLSNKYGQRLFDSATKSVTDAIKTVSTRAIEKTAEASGDLIGNKIVDKVTSVSKKSDKELQNDEANNVIETSKTSPKNVPKNMYHQKKDNNKIFFATGANILLFLQISLPVFYPLFYGIIKIS